jgi:glycosyltransferase involved in cell wall biosynthesis
MERKLRGGTPATSQQPDPPNRTATRVSVIIPTYNAAAYVREAVESALAQPETGEVILVEDASRDNSLQVCEQLAKEYSQVRLMRHKDGKNHGAGASRNLGIAAARFGFVAFLDADDYFLPDRFSVARNLLLNDATVEGVYEAVGMSFEGPASRKRWRRAGKSDSGPTTMTESVPPEDLFEKMDPIGGRGFCQLDGWTVKKSVFGKAGLFPDLRLHQDTVMFAKLAAVGKMLPGRLREPVAIRRVHAKNRISEPRPRAGVYRSRIRMWVTLWRWGKVNLPLPRQRLLMQRFMEYAGKPFSRTRSRVARLLLPRIQMLLLGLAYPGLLLETPFWRSCYRTTVPSRIRRRLIRSAALRVDSSVGGSTLSRPLPPHPHPQSRATRAAHRNGENVLP